MIRCTEQDLANERAVIARLEVALDVDIVHHADKITHPYDFDSYEMVVGTPHAHGEIKCRSGLYCNSFGPDGPLKNQGVWLELRKYEALIAAADADGAVPLFVVHFMGCGCIRYINVLHRSVDPSAVHLGGRTDRGDENDIDMVIDVYTERMVVLPGTGAKSCLAATAKCRACGRSDWWLGDGAWVCSTCHPQIGGRQ